MRISNCARTVAFAIGCLLISTAINAAQPWYELQIVIPSGASGQVTTQLTGGWPLVIRATAPGGAPTYAYSDSDSYDLDGPLAVVASDPGGCFDKLISGDPGACLSDSPNELYTNLWIDTDTPAVADSGGGDGALITALVDSAGGGGPIFLGIAGGSLAYVRAGPYTGGGVRDGYGYGANDDWPQLVLLSSHGVGVVLDQSFNRGPTERRRNLAGFLEWVAYEVAGAKSRSVISSGTIVPFALFSPLIMVDEAVGEPDSSGKYQSYFQFRIDGGPIRSGNSNCLRNQYGELLYSIEYELRAFLVNGSAPGVLSDMDADGDVDAVDAELSGMEVISSEQTVRFRLWDGKFGGDDAYLHDRSNRIYADLDGIGGSNGPCDDSDIGPGKVRPPPK